VTLNWLLRLNSTRSIMNVNFINKAHISINITDDVHLYHARTADSQNRDSAIIHRAEGLAGRKGGTARRDVCYIHVEHTLFAVRNVNVPATSRNDLRALIDSSHYATVARQLISTIQDLVRMILRDSRTRAGTSTRHQASKYMRYVEYYVIRRA